MALEIRFKNVAIAREFAEGTLIPLATYFYDAKKGCIRIEFVAGHGRSKEEIVAMLKEGNCLPEDVTHSDLE